MTKKDSYLALGDPVKVGLLVDLPEKYAEQMFKLYDLVREQIMAQRGFERGFEFVVEHSYGPPAGPIKSTTDAYHRLVDQGCLVVVGPNHSDSNIAISPHAEVRKVPLIALGATAQHMSPHVFSVAWSSIPHDAYACAGWLKKQGCKRVAVTRDRADHALEYLVHFRVAAQRAGLRILTEDRIPQIVSPELDGIFVNLLEELQGLKPDGIVHFGTCETAALWAAHVTASGWAIPRVMNDAFYGAYFPHYTPGFEGWVGTTMWDDSNQVLADFRRAYEARYPGEAVPPHEMMAHYRDAMTAALEGVLQASILTPEGVRRGLESLQMLPAAAGGPRTCISFAPHDHRGHKGADVMVLRRVKGGEVVMEGRVELF